MTMIDPGSELDFVRCKTCSKLTTRAAFVRRGGCRKGCNPPAIVQPRIRQITPERARIVLSPSERVYLIWKITRYHKWPKIKAWLRLARADRPTTSSQ